MGILAFLEIRRFGTDIDRTGVSKIAGGLEDGTLLTVIKRDILYVIKRELAQVNLSVLRIT